MSETTQQQPKALTRNRYCVACGSPLAPGKCICLECGKDNGGVPAVAGEKFVAVQGQPVVMRGALFIARACTNNMARRIARALNLHETNEDGR